MSNFSSSKYQRGHGKHGFDQVSWPANSKQQGLLGHMTSHHTHTITYIFSQKIAKKRTILKLLKVPKIHRK